MSGCMDKSMLILISLRHRLISSRLYHDGNFPAAVANVNILAWFFYFFFLSLRSSLGSSHLLFATCAFIIFCDLREIKSCKDEPNRRNKVER